jgi:hypothetical protein
MVFILLVLAVAIIASLVRGRNAPHVTPVEVEAH